MVGFINENIIFLTILGSCLCLVGILGFSFSHKNLITILIALEILLLGISFLFIIFSLFWDDLAGQVIALCILAVAGAESAIGLALLLRLFKIRGKI